MFPATCSLSVGAATPTPMFPLDRIVKSDTPDEDATLNGLRGDDVDDCTVKAKVDDVALIPVTAPLSIKVEVPRVVEVNQRVAYPKAPPDTPEAVRPRDVVATHFVLVPVVWRSIPEVPGRLKESKSVPRSERLVVEALVIRKFVEEPVPAKKVVAVALVAVRFVAEALTTAKLLVPVALVKKSVEAVRPPVEEALVKLRFVVVALVAKKLVDVALVMTDDVAKMF